MKHSTFTHLCQQLALVRERKRADLHLHTTFSDGTHSPESLVDRAQNAGLSAIAVTDHDTLSGIEPTLAATNGRLEVVSGVEITCEFHDSELHLLGYFVRLDDSALNATLAQLRQSRRARLIEIARRLQAIGIDVVAEVSAIPDHVSMGRRHLARILIDRQFSRSLHDVFTRILAGDSIRSVPKLRIPVAQAIQLIHTAGGVSSWAHPPVQSARESLAELQLMGLDAVECVYPWPTGTHGKRLRSWADTLGLAVTGGSDSHDAGPAGRTVGAKAISWDELARIRLIAQSMLDSPSR